MFVNVCAAVNVHQRLEIEVDEDTTWAQVAQKIDPNRTLSFYHAGKKLENSSPAWFLGAEEETVHVIVKLACQASLLD